MHVTHKAAQCQIRSVYGQDQFFMYNADTLLSQKDN